MTSFIEYIIFVLSLSIILQYYKEDISDENIMLVLGCSNSYIQEQRIQSLFEYIENTNKPTVLYLSGGKKTSELKETEADTMLKKINKKYPNLEIHIDRTATNTAENFINFNKWVEEKNANKIIINTSDFHKERAEKIFNNVIKNKIPEWNLSISNCEWCWEDEKIHMKNIEKDINRSLQQI